MDRIIGAVLGLAAGLAVVLLGLWKEVPLKDSMWRALLAVFLGYLVGWVFGKAGLSIVKEAAGPVPPPPGGPAEAKGPGTPPAAPPAKPD